MPGDESTIEKHTILAHKLLEDAAAEIASGDLMQGGEKLWGATSQALRAYCESHGLPHGRYQHRRRAVLDLADARGEPFIRATFGIAQACHGNFYNDSIEQEDMETYLPDIRELVRAILDARAE